MPKPEKQKSSGVACLIDGILTKRVQTLGSSVDITREQAQELANSGVVEYISDSPTVSIQIDTNDVGSTDTMAIICDAMLTYTHTAEVEPRGGVYKHFIKAASSNASYREITQLDMVNGYCGVFATLDQDGTAAARSLWMNHCAVTGVNLSYDVNGNATENYTLTADNKTWFFNDLKDVRLYKCLNYQIGYSTAGITFQYLDSAIPDDSSVVAVGVNNNILRSRDIGGVTGNATMTAGGVQGGMVQCTSVALSTPWASTASGSTDRVWIVYKPAGQDGLWEAENDALSPGWELESSAGAFGAVRRGHVKAYIYNTNSGSNSTYTKAGKALRLQSVSIDVALGEEPLFELGTDGFYGISKNTPVPITVTASFNDSDLQYFAMLTSTAYGDSNVKTISIEDFNGYNALRLDIYQDKAQTILLKTIVCDNMYVQSENFNVSVGDNATNEITFTNDNISITGSGVNITGGHSG